MFRVFLYGLVALIAIWLIAPLFVVVVTSFNADASYNFPPTELSLRWYANFFGDAGWRRSFWDSVTVAFASALLATVVGAMAAITLHRSTFFGRQAISGLFIGPAMVPGILLAIGLYALFTRLGLLGTLQGFIFAHAVVALPLVVINVGAALQTLDPKLEVAAASLGAGKINVVRQITLPLILPGIIAGSVFAFVHSFDEIIISLFIQSPYLQTLPVKMYQSVTHDSDPTVAAVAVLMMLISIGLAACTMLFQPRRTRK
ncbi:ABC transporter permease [Pelagibacterium lacus]|uniref:ABC transporter permease n=1 Tax=Pelagibacterium lacus TaxID=2282655 RepID=A0A369W172_9HYPH|nr:ABC transporter permease [Pelagibacterium lacus]RDE07789.1 ABC transporter permease [Pelagibacterium lacus]